MGLRSVPVPSPAPQFERMRGETEEAFSLRCKKRAYVSGHLTLEEYEDMVERALRFYAARPQF